MSVAGTPDICPSVGREDTSTAWAKAAEGRMSNTINITRYILHPDRINILPPMTAARVMGEERMMDSGVTEDDE